MAEFGRLTFTFTRADFSHFIPDTLLPLRGAEARRVLLILTEMIRLLA